MYYPVPRDLKNILRMFQAQVAKQQKLRKFSLSLKIRHSNKKKRVYQQDRLHCINFVYRKLCISNSYVIYSCFCFPIRVQCATSDNGTDGRGRPCLASQGGMIPHVV